MSKLKCLWSIAIILAMSACSRPNEGNFLVVRNWDKTYRTDVERGLEATFFDDAFEVSGRERLLSVDDARPKDSESVMLQDLDVTVAWKIGADRAVPFLRKYGDMKQDDSGVWVLGETYLRKDAKSVLGETIRKFASMQLLDEKKKVEDAFKKDLQAEVDRLYGPGVFEITEVKIANVVVSPATEERIQAVALINSEKARADAELRVLDIRRDLATKQMKLLSDVSAASGVTVDQILESRRLDILERMPSGAVTVTVPSDSKK